MRALGRRERRQGADGHRGRDSAEAVGSGGGTWAGEGVGAGGNGLEGLKSRWESEPWLGEQAQPVSLQVCPLSCAGG